jgi:hypothetical protein
MVSEPQGDELDRLIAEMGGTVTFSRGRGGGAAAAFGEHREKGAPGPLYEYTWNHTTLHALKVDPNITYLQLRFPPGRNLELLDWAESISTTTCCSTSSSSAGRARSIIPACRWCASARPSACTRSCAQAEEAGIQASNPHSWVLNNAGWKQIDAPQPEFKRLADPMA